MSEQPQGRRDTRDRNNDGRVSAQELIDYATQPEFLNTPYIDHSTIANWGPGNGWDCSSYTSYVFKKFGIDLPAYSDSQYNMGTKVAREDLQPGDLVFFHTNPNKVTGHVGIYVGDGKMVNAANPDSDTRIQPMTWDTYVGARRVLATDGQANLTNKPVSADDGRYDGDSAAEDDVRRRSDVDTPEEVAAQYGYTYAFMEANKPLKKWFDEFAAEYIAADGQISYETFKLGFNQVPIIKNHDQTWLEDWRLEHESPDLYDQKVNGSMDTLRDIAAKMGATVDEATLRKLAKQSQRFGYDGSQTQDMLSGFVRANNGTYLGDAGINANSLKSWAINNDIAINDSMIDGYVRGIAAGDTTIEDAKQQLRDQYMGGTYPAWADKIAAGQDIWDLSSPYRAEMGRMLGLDPMSIRLDDPLLSRGLSTTAEDGTISAAPISAFRVMARKDQRWLDGPDGGNTIAAAGNDLFKTFGMVG